MRNVFTDVLGLVVEAVVSVAHKVVEVIYNAITWIACSVLVFFLFDTLCKYLAVMAYYALGAVLLVLFLVGYFLLFGAAPAMWLLCLLLGMYCWFVGGRVLAYTLS